MSKDQVCKFRHVGSMRLPIMESFKLVSCRKVAVFRILNLHS